MTKKLTFRQLSDGEGHNGVYKTWATAEKFTELIKILLSQTPEKYRIKLAEEILILLNNFVISF